MPSTILDNRYTLLERLGSGGMAEVHLAHDEVLDRDIALKMLRHQYADDEDFVGRFQREARNAASLSHPNIVQIYDQGRAEDGTYYMAMEYAPGGTLKDRIVEMGALEPREATGLAAQVAEALEVAHGRGIVHRDIKPQNVLLTPSGDAKVADFGIARAASATVVTQTHLVLGTAGYMSPEQAAGERVGPASDLYSLGVVLYEMLTGNLPYEAETPIAVAMKHINAPPLHPGEDNPGVPGDLDAVTVKLLSKAPEDRYASAADLAEDLKRISAGLPPAGLAAGEATRVNTTRAYASSPTVAGPTSKPGAAPRRGRRGVSPALAALLVALLLLGGIAWGLSQSGGGDQTDIPDVLNLRLEEARSKLSDAGFEVRATRVESAAEEEGLVLEQSPSGGESAEKGSTVELTVGEGPSIVSVPDIPYGATEAEARSQLEEAGLKLGTVSRTPSDQVSEGGVVAQDPLPETKVERGTAVDITLSSGPAQQAPVSPVTPSDLESEKEKIQRDTEKAIEEAQEDAEKQQEAAEEALKKQLEEPEEKPEKD